MIQFRLVTMIAKTTTGTRNPRISAQTVTHRLREITKNPPYTMYVLYAAFLFWLSIYIYSSLTVWRQSIDRQWYEVCELKHDRIYVSAYLFVCLFMSLSVCLSKGTLPFASDLYKLCHCIGLKHNFSEASQSQNNLNWSTQRKYVVVTLDHPGSSSGERVCPLFQRLWTWAKKILIACLSVCHKPTILFS